MARNRAIRKRKSRKKIQLMDLDITSLLDILVILLVFLLKSYSTSNIIINVPKEISLPTSQSESPNSEGVIVQVSKEKIWVDSNEIVNYLDPIPGKKVFDHGGRLVVPLYDELVRIKEGIELTNMQVNMDKKFSGVANLVLDKEVKFQEIKRVLYTAAEAGFQKYKFVVLGEEQY
jgi:biopolymer transport protein ExbD